MQRSFVKDILSSKDFGQTVLVQGWVRTRRDSKDFSFLEMNDGSCLGNVQAIVDSSLPSYKDVLKTHTGAAIEIEGELVESPGKGQSVEIRATKFTLVGECPAEGYPLQKKRHTNEFLRTIAHLRPRTNLFGAVFRVRNAASFAIHSFFQERGFIQLHSPIITTSDCEGAGEMFSVTTLDLDALVKLPPSSKLDWSQDFFGQHASLTVSGQLQGEAFASAMSNIYTFGPTFRAENSNTPRHLAEFWMVEPEMAFCDLAGDMDLAEDFIKYCISYVLDSCENDLTLFDTWVEKGIISSLSKLVSSSFERMTYDKAISVLQKSGKKFEFPVEWGCDLQTEHERYLTEEHIGGPVFVTNYPKDIKAFYMRLDESGKTVSAMDLLVPRCGEIIGGSQREEREDVLISRIEECGIEREHLEWYLDLRRFGSVPHAGFGLGFERLVMYLTGVSNIRDAIPFPRTPGSAHF